MPLAQKNDTALKAAAESPTGSWQGRSVLSPSRCCSPGVTAQRRSHRSPSHNRHSTRQSPLAVTSSSPPHGSSPSTPCPATSLLLKTSPPGSLLSPSVASINGPKRGHSWTMQDSPLRAKHAVSIIRQRSTDNRFALLSSNTPGQAPPCT